MKRLLLATGSITLFLVAHAYVVPEAPLPGAEKSGKTQLLEAGATALQSDAPADGLNIHLVGLHPMKANPAHQMDVHHFCRQMNEDFAQCALFDGDGANARLTGIEYIISAALFEKLPARERQYWHPHNYEILSGMLAAPGLPSAAEQALMRSKMNSYGKTWHVWNTGMVSMDGKPVPGDALPLGEPELAWSLNRDGEADPGLLKEHGRLLGLDLTKRREQRAELRELAQPQEGVDALRGQFDRPTSSLPGVSDKTEFHTGS